MNIEKTIKWVLGIGVTICVLSAAAFVYDYKLQRERVIKNNPVNVMGINELWKIYNNDNYGFEFSYPPTHTIDVIKDYNPGIDVVNIRRIESDSIVNGQFYVPKDIFEFVIFKNYQPIIETFDSASSANEYPYNSETCGNKGCATDIYSPAKFGEITGFLVESWGEPGPPAYSFEFKTKAGIIRVQLNSYLEGLTKDEPSPLDTDVSLETYTKVKDSLKLIP